eukprot:9012335-Pyramimonas_sp.AAC.1
MRRRKRHDDADEADADAAADDGDDDDAAADDDDDGDDDDDDEDEEEEKEEEEKLEVEGVFPATARLCIASSGLIPRPRRGVAAVAEILWRWRDVRRQEGRFGGRGNQRVRVRGHGVQRP